MQETPSNSSPSTRYKIILFLSTSYDEIDPFNFLLCGVCLGNSYGTVSKDKIVILGAITLRINRNIRVFTVELVSSGVGYLHGSL